MSVRFGRHWSYTSGVLTLFEEFGQIFEKMPYFGSSRGDLVQVTPEKVGQYIHGNLNMLHHAMAADRFAYIGIDVYRAFYLYFEGSLTIEALEDAIEDQESIGLSLFLEDRLLHFDIRRQTPSPIIFYDGQGKAIVHF